ncbi:MAG: hypothetical protein U0P45_02075 [Acidimicrobiales bacterium]
MRARPTFLLGPLAAAALLVACSSGSDAPPSTTKQPTTTATTTASTSTTKTTTPPASARVLGPADVGEGWVADAYDPAEVGSPCGTTNTDELIPPKAKVGMVAVAKAKDGRAQEDVRSYADASTAGRAYDSLLSEVDCPSGSVPDGQGGSIALTIGPTAAVTSLGPKVDQAAKKEISAAGFQGRSLIAQVGSDVVIVQIMQPDGATTPTPSIESLAKQAIDRLGS